MNDLLNNKLSHFVRGSYTTLIMFTLLKQIFNGFDSIRKWFAVEVKIILYPILCLFIRTHKYGCMSKH